MSPKTDVWRHGIVTGCSRWPFTKASSHSHPSKRSPRSQWALVTGGIRHTEVHNQSRCSPPRSELCAVMTVLDTSDTLHNDSVGKSRLSSPPKPSKCLMKLKMLHAFLKKKKHHPKTKHWERIEVPGRQGSRAITRGCFRTPEGLPEFLNIMKLKIHYNIQSRLTTKNTSHELLCSRFVTQRKHKFHVLPRRWNNLQEK